MRCQYASVLTTCRWIFSLACLINGRFLVSGRPASTGGNAVKTDSRDSQTNTARKLDPPDGFSVKIKRSGEEKDLVSKELYSATLHALLHFSLHSYDARAEPYSTRGPEPSGSIVVSAVVFAGPPGYIPLNCHLAWGLYRSVIAFNSPDNVRESVATVSLDGRRSAQIEYLQARKASLIARDSPKNDTTSLSLFSATPTRRANDKGVMTPAALKFDVNGYEFDEKQRTIR
ncbi:MAG: hypothetical protein L6R40_008159 [Gallowayella cf. fulva]|nr:MAG: hypothetical protein L6R40_008159 [Xanthomendoza cf. fulva]